MTTTTVRVGARSTTVDDAFVFVRRYLNAPEERWSYPAYDEYPGAATDLLGPQDLFAPELLNAGLNLGSYYAFLSVLDEVNAALAAVPTGVALDEAENVAVTAVADLIGVLDDPSIPGVKLTKLSKVLHRKRPSLIPLYDEQIRRCYQDGDGAPVPAANRTWREFATLWLGAVQADLASQLDVWRALAALTPPGGPTITPLRALDIVGWRLGSRATDRGLTRLTTPREA
ncbi:DUF6308 family protein [Cellulomonas sp. CW35]|uniref:DUF6308 family protein n=1 Tax=Cellulomonas sp. CW35 TaxID=3458249 RepID=UPI004033176E